MKYIYSFLSNVKKIIRSRDKILLLLDYDGTLTPIALRPSDAVLSNKARKLLNSLAKKEKFIIGIISGRKLSDVKDFVKVKGIFYAGNHGLEIEGPGIQFIHPGYVKFKAFINHINKELKQGLASIKGLIIENKGLSLSIHYRTVKEKDILNLKNSFRSLMSSYLIRKKIRVTFGKKVFEIRPPIDWDKGKALKTIRRLIKKNESLLTIFIGDDTTDEDAFRVLKKGDISIFVGQNKKSCARFYLKNPDEVGYFLSQILDL